MGETFTVGWWTYNLDDVEHDLAMMTLDVEKHPDWKETFGDLIEEYTKILQDAGRPLPTNIREETNIYARGGKRLLYDLEEKHANRE